MAFIASCMALFFIPISTCSIQKSDVAERHVLTIWKHSTFVNDSLVDSKILYPLALMNGLLILMAIITIFLYKRRQRQMRICGFLMIAVISMLAFAFQKSDSLQTDTTAKPEYHAGMYIILTLILWIFLAYRSIKKDELLVRSADRLR
jgi:hypothetical protein